MTFSVTHFLPALALALGLLLVSGVDASIPEPDDSQVHVLNFDNFHRFLRKHELCVVEFYAPWCGHCKDLAPKYREAAKILAAADLPQEVALAKFDDGDDYNRNLRAGAEDMFNYSSYPTLLVFRDDDVDYAKDEHWPYEYRGKKYGFYGGGRDSAQDIVDYMTAVAKGQDPFEAERMSRPGFYKKGGKHESDVITDLEPDGETHFNKTVLEEQDNVVWVVEFYSDRCPFCNSLAPEMHKAATKAKADFGDKVKYGAVNSRVYHEIAEAHEILSYPWVAAFYRGKKVEDMAGLGGWESVYNWGKHHSTDTWKKSPPKNEFLESEWASAKVEARAAEAKSSSGGKKTKEKDLGELDSLLAKAVKYNLMNKKNAKAMRKKALKSNAAQKKSVAKLREKLGPILDLEEKAGVKDEL